MLLIISFQSLILILLLMSFRLIVLDDSTGEIEFCCYLPFVDSYVVDFVAVSKLLKVHFPFTFQVVRIATVSDDSLPPVNSRYNFIRPTILSASFSFTFWYKFCCKLEDVAYKTIIQV